MSRFKCVCVCVLIVFLLVSIEKYLIPLIFRWRDECITIKFPLNEFHLPEPHRIFRNRRSMASLGALNNRNRRFTLGTTLPQGPYFAMFKATFATFSLVFQLSRFIYISHLSIFYFFKPNKRILKD